MVNMAMHNYHGKCEKTLSKFKAKSFKNRKKKNSISRLKSVCGLFYWSLRSFFLLLLVKLSSAVVVFFFFVSVFRSTFFLIVAEITAR